MGILSIPVQVLALSYKNAISSMRSWGGSLVRMLLPSIILVVFYLMLLSAPSGEVAHPKPTRWIGSIPKCVTGKDTSACVTLLYSPDNEVTRQVMQIVADGSGLTVGATQDIQPTLLSMSELMHQVTNTPNITQAAIYFTVCCCHCHNDVANMAY
jgi:hypothetical protein